MNHFPAPHLRLRFLAWGREPGTAGGYFSRIPIFVQSLEGLARTQLRAIVAAQMPLLGKNSGCHLLTRLQEFR